MGKNRMNINEAVLQEINRTFAKEDIDKVVTALTNAPNPIPDSDRLQFAILKLAKGNLTEFNEALQLASLDWRDVLAAAEMAEKKNKSWWQFWK